MVPGKSLEEISIFQSLIYDVYTSLGDINKRALKLTQQKVSKRVRFEGMGFLTKTLPKLGKHLDEALALKCTIDATKVGFDTLPGSKLPRFLGELFSRVFDKSGNLLPTPDANCVKHIRFITYSFYKYELPYSDRQEQQVVSAFVSAEADLSNMQGKIASLQSALNGYNTPGLAFSRKFREDIPLDAPIDACILSVVREAKKLLYKLFDSFDGYDIIPGHGPGAVATKQKHAKKFHWTNVSSRITDVYPFDAYFCASAGHVCDLYDSTSKYLQPKYAKRIGRIPMDAVTSHELSAKVVLVPKDSRGPRLISEEPVDFQWIQQGLKKAIYRRVESHPLTKWNVHFTDQGPNQRGALLGSSTGGYATLDLKEASDRVSLDLVRLLFPEKVLPFLECSRSLSTVLPDGKKLVLHKYAPMGSALCFPVLALTIWSLLTARAPDADTREGILVYGDDVVVPTAFADTAMTTLEAFGLKINRSKSFVQGQFRESCGVDAYQGVNVTPVRLRTVWNKSRSADAYVSWISYANSYYNAGYIHTYDEIVSRLEAIYGPLPCQDERKLWPGVVAPYHKERSRTRWNKTFHKREMRVRVVISPRTEYESDGWEMLLRYFTEGSSQTSSSPVNEEHDASKQIAGLDEQLVRPAFKVRQYTHRRSGKLVWRWR